MLVGILAGGCVGLNNSSKECLWTRPACYDAQCTNSNALVKWRMQTQTKERDNACWG
jgi:hypothetical protein